jgi:hypothetical protein
MRANMCSCILWGSSYDLMLMLWLHVGLWVCVCCFRFLPMACPLCGLCCLHEWPQPDDEHIISSMHVNSFTHSLFAFRQSIQGPTNLLDIEDMEAKAMASLILNTVTFLTDIFWCLYIIRKVF